MDGSTSTVRVAPFTCSVILAIGFASPSEQPLIAFPAGSLAQHSSLARVGREIKILELGHLCHLVIWTLIGQLNDQMSR